jgi:multicomponent Na+:H+ antiporter subunit G
MRLLADLFLLTGAIFIFLAALGLLRMPDVYNRIQVGTKAATLGALAFFIGIGLLYPAWWPKLLVLAGFVLLTNPVGSSTIARALYIAGVRPWHASAKAPDAQPVPAESSEGA